MKAIAVKIGIMLMLAVTANSVAKPKLDPFFANQELQQRQPTAFVLQPKAEPFLRSVWPQTQQHGEQLAAAIKDDDELSDIISQWQTVPEQQRLLALSKIMALQCQLLNVPQPKLVIDGVSQPNRLAYFEFDLAKPESTTVYLNSERLQQQPPLTSLSLLLHEVRHAYQFQLIGKKGLVGQGFRAGFEAQTALSPKSFSDFLTMNHEYEAFQFSNLVIGELFDWKVDLPGMGTYASQYWADKSLKIDLLQMLDQDNPTPLIDQFNLEMTKQKLKLGR